MSATATSRKVAPPAKALAARRTLAEQRLALERKLQPDYAVMAQLDAELKKAATDAGESFKEDFGGLGYVSASGAVAAEFKGDVPQVVTEKWNALKKSEQNELIRSGVVKIEKQFGKASNGRVTLKVL